MGELKALRGLKAEQALNSVSHTEPYYDDFVRLSKELEGKSADEAVKILKKEKGRLGAYSLANITKETGFVDLLPNLLKKEGLTMDDFRMLMQKRAEVLTNSEKLKLDNIRNALPKVNENTILQKVIQKDEIINYLKDKDPYNTIGGYISTASDAKHLKGLEDYYYGLRLDYPKSVFDVGDGYCYAIRFKTKDLNDLVIPRDGKFSVNDYPFTRNGFTAGNNGRLGVSELVFDNKKYVTPTEGAEIWKVNYDGSEEIIAIFKNKRFDKVK